jgi:Concanavalin A-like lectin/glucanases superfamily
MRGPRRGRGVVTTLLLGALGALCVSVGAAGAADTPSQVIGQWRFDEAGGQAAVDDGPFGLDGRLGPTDGADASDPGRIAGLSGGALRFGGGSFVRLPASPQLEPATLTLESVVRAGASPGPFRYVVAHGAQGCVAGSYGLYTAAHGGLAFYVFDGRDYYVTAEVAPAAIWNGGWHHVAATFDGAALRLFVDGHPVGAAFPAPLTIAYTLTSNDHYFGTYQGTCALPLAGDVDLIRLWRGPLAPDLIASLAAAALTPGAPPATVPSATTDQSHGDAAATATTIAPIAPGTSYKPAGGGGGRGKPSDTPGAPGRACVLTPSSTRVRAGHATTLTVRVALRGTPLKAVRVVAMAAARRRVAQGTTATNGRARLKLKTSRRGTLRLKAVGRTDCGGATLSVLKAKAAA